jgi:hypothetical protein
VDWRAEVLRTADVTAYLLDISERKRAEERLQYQAWHEALTDLANRARAADGAAAADFCGRTAARFAHGLAAHGSSMASRT